MKFLYKYHFRKILFFTCILLRIAFSAYAQDVTRIDSLKKIATLATIDTATIDANKQLSIEYQEDNPDLAIQYGMIAANKSGILKDQFRLAQSYKLTGIAYDYEGNVDSCLHYLREALALFTTISRKDYESHTLTDIAMAYYYRGNYELALRNHLSALEKRKQFGEPKFIAQSYLNIGLVYRSRKDYENSIKFYKQSFEIKKQIQDEPGMLNTLLNIGAAFQTEGNFDSAYVYSLKALVLATELNKVKDIAAARENIAASLINLERSAEAIKYLKLSDTSSLSKDQLLTHCESFGDLFLQQRNTNEAITWFLAGLANAKSNGRTEAMEVFNRKLAACFFIKNDYLKAYQFALISRQLSDTLLNQENSRQVNELTAVYENAEKETLIEKLNSANAVSLTEEKSRRTERNYFIFCSVLFGLLAAVAYKALKSNRTKNKIIQQSLAEKEILLREIHHRVKNNLQIVSSLLSLQSNYIKDEKALDAVKDSRNRVHSMGLIHQHLYQEQDVTSIDVQEYMAQLADNLFQSYNINGENVVLEKKIAPIKLDIDTLIPIGLIMNELLTNCLKYAFPAGRKGKINLLLQEVENRLQLSVYDDGEGLPNDFNTKGKASFGHSMIDAFLMKLDGEMKINSDGGTKVDIFINKYKKN